MKPECYHVFNLKGICMKCGGPNETHQVIPKFIPAPDRRSTYGLYSAKKRRKSQA